MVVGGEMRYEMQDEHRRYRYSGLLTNSSLKHTNTISTCYAYWCKA